MGPRSRLGVNLDLVSVIAPYRPALDISGRPELARAFARGEADRAGPRELSDAYTGELMEMSADERDAYLLGYSESEAYALAPLYVPTLLFLVGLLREQLAQVQRPRTRKLALYAVDIALVFYGQRLAMQSQIRRARALGITAETAPRPPGFTVILGPMAARTLLVGVQQLRVRRRTGLWGRPSASSRAAAFAIAEFRRRQAWRAAYEPAPPRT